MSNTAALKPSYFGQTIYVGIDVHKRTYVVVARMHQKEIKRWTTTASPEQLGQQLTNFFAGAVIYSAYEACFSGFVLHRALSAAGLRSRVVHAASVEVAANSRVKTDQRDARKLAEQLESGRLRGLRFSQRQPDGRRTATPEWL